MSEIEIETFDCSSKVPDLWDCAPIVVSSFELDILGMSTLRLFGKFGGG
jgi:hypothetical protein